MNNILQLKGSFEQRKGSPVPSTLTLSKGKFVSSEHLYSLAGQMNGIFNYWKTNTDINGALVSVHYTRIVPKSERLQILLSENSNSPAASIRGAKFESDYDENGQFIKKHVFTYFVSLFAIDKTIKLLNDVAKVIEKHYSGTIYGEDTDQIANNKDYYNGEIPRTNFLKCIKDAFNVERFDIDEISELPEGESIITIYQTGVETKKLLSNFGINIYDDRIIDKTMLRLNKDEIDLLYNKAPYLISMGLTDFTELDLEDLNDENSQYNDQIPSPSDEPVIGVIDTPFNNEVYFHEWVEDHNLLDPNITLEPKDYEHGTEVSSIIVDGPKGNPSLDDGCGRFRVRHFGVATSKGFSSFAVLKHIQEIVAENRDIKVWNLSLGSLTEIDSNFISPEAYILDRIQNEYDVIFVIAGTNTPSGVTNTDMKIGAPADSLNSVVVNSVNFTGEPASYTREGPVLSFFLKPDVSYYGGDGVNPDGRIAVCHDDKGAYYKCGTSYAAPWISRKLAYLIQIMGLSRESAKALIIDSAAGWSKRGKEAEKIGYGIVPTDINDIIHTSDDEIKFILTGSTDEYETYTYNIPVPIVNDTQPYYSKATLVYFPQCDRNQGVDYTSTEMDIHFGRVSVDHQGKTFIKSINNNEQSEDKKITLWEENARKIYRKWDNIKHIGEIIKQRKIAKKVYESGMWGLKIVTKQRGIGEREPLQFGVVITLKEMNGINRFDDFKRLCMARGWLVNELNVENQVEIYNKAEEEIEFDDE